MIVTAILEKKQKIDFDIPEKWAIEFESIELAFIDEDIPLSVLKRFAQAKGFKLIPTYQAMRKVAYYNKDGDRYIRHGNLKKTSKCYILTPSDSTIKIEIPFDCFIKSSKCRVRKTKMVYVQGKYIPQPDDPT